MAAVAARCFRELRRACWAVCLPGFDRTLSLMPALVARILPRPRANGSYPRGLSPRRIAVGFCARRPDSALVFPMFRKAEDDFKSGSLRPRVLVVDDDPVTLEVVRERLETLGYVVTVRSEAIGTAQWIAQEQPEFVLLDVSMPALSGTGLAQILGRNSSTRSTAVILHSSRD